MAQVIENPMVSGYGHPIHDQYSDTEFDARAIFDELREEEAKERPVTAITKRPGTEYHQ